MRNFTICGRRRWNGQAIATQTVLAMRNPLEVAAALNTSHRLASNKALQAWV